VTEAQQLDAKLKAQELNVKLAQVGTGVLRLTENVWLPVCYGSMLYDVYVGAGWVMGEPSVLAIATETEAKAQALVDRGIVDGVPVMGRHARCFMWALSYETNELYAHVEERLPALRQAWSQIWDRKIVSAAGIVEQLPTYFTEQDRADFNRKAAAVGEGVLRYAGKFFPVMQGQVLHLYNLWGKTERGDKRTVRVVTCQSEKSARRYLSVEDGKSTTNTALYGNNVEFQTTPTHCFFWAAAQDQWALLHLIGDRYVNWQSRALGVCPAKVVASDPFEELSREVKAARRRLEQEEERKQRESRQRQEAREAREEARKAVREREQAELHAEWDRIRQARAAKRKERVAATECSHCHAPFKPGAMKYEALAGFRCGRCLTSGSTDSVEGHDKKGRPKYRYGHRRADGIWVCPPGAAHGLSWIGNNVQPRSFFFNDARAPKHLYGDRLRPGSRYGAPPWWANAGPHVFRERVNKPREADVEE